MQVLVLNCGSSSLKFAVIDSSTGTQSLVGLASNLGTAGAGIFDWQAGDERDRAALDESSHADALMALTRLLESRPSLGEALAGVGHRVVHGGEAFTASCLIDDSVLAAIESVSGLAPLHNPPNLLGIRAAQQVFPVLPQVAVFDTAFHQSMPERAYLYALPRKLYEEHRVRRYGFHGTSHRYVAREAARMLGRELSASSFITAHLGNGCSIAAIAEGRCMDTSMGMTPLEGLVMGTRSGDIDPGLHQLLCERLGTDIAGVTALLNEQSGLLGLSGLSNDMRTLLEAEAEGHEGAKTAIEIFCYRLAKQIAGMLVSIGREPDAIVFTGGIGERASAIRERVAELLAPIGVRLDTLRNQSHGADSQGTITLAEASPRAMVVPTNEERMIAEDTAQQIEASQ